MSRSNTERARVTTDFATANVCVSVCMCVKVSAKHTNQGETRLLVPCGRAYNPPPSCFALPYDSYYFTHDVIRPKERWNKRENPCTRRPANRRQWIASCQKEKKITRKIRRSWGEKWMNWSRRNNRLETCVHKPA